ncbi:UNKNOWN [Stylonychia lemnae]|uniref:Uncharacterized protein n=1 Tax=Stylonychia lemnae TaxID=5949 RepID=A0A078B428_STYLE|nr:UNKNOWN [Stylonychia lemnae]|eukprot:CDW89239.1 UNKNOWN [Stylonychia lemnae]
MVAWNHLRFNRPLFVKSKIQLARVYFELGNHYESRKLFKKIKSQIKTEEVLQNNKNIILQFYIAKSKYFLSLRLFKKYSKSVIKMCDFIDEDKNIQIKQVQKFLQLSNLSSSINPKETEEVLKKKLDMNNLQEYFKTALLPFFSIHIESQFLKLFYLKKDLSSIFAFRTLMELKNRVNQLEEYKFIQDGCNFINLNYRILKTIELVCGDDYKLKIEEAEQEFSNIINDYKNYLDNFEFQQIIIKASKIILDFTQFEALEDILRDFVIGQIFEFRSENYPLSIYSCYPILDIAQTVHILSKRGISLSLFCQQELKFKAQQFEDIFLEKSIEVFPEDYLNNAKAKQRIQELNLKITNEQLDLKDYIVKLEEILTQLSKDQYHGQRDHIFESLLFIKVREVLNSQQNFPPEQKQEYEIYQQRRVYYQQRNTIDYYQQGSDKTIFGLMSMFVKNKLFEEFKQITYDFIEIKVNQAKIHDLAQMMPYVIAMIYELGDTKFSVEIIDKTLELLKALPLIFYADQIFMERILTLLTTLKLYELGLNYSELTIGLCDRYEQPAQPNDQVQKLKKRFRLFKYQCLLELDRSNSRSELKKIQEDINQIETVFGEDGDIQSRIVEIKQRLHVLTEKSDQALLLKALGFGLLASGIVITAVVYFTKKRN